MRDSIWGVQECQILFGGKSDAYSRRCGLSYHVGCDGRCGLLFNKGWSTCVRASMCQYEQLCVVVFGSGSAPAIVASAYLPDPGVESA
eukprot:7879373-Pyramimonas_sp.AAC.1